ncbi:MAG: hypothetical protein ACOYL6_03005 [Bacteriovoracaceae bacterium]
MASLTQFDVSGSDKISFDFKKVCEAMGFKETPIVSVPSINTLDCMGSKIAVMDFCLKDFAKDPRFIRAFIDRKDKLVVCEKASHIMLKYECEKKDDNRCIDSEIGCYDLKKTLAYNLKVFRHSILSVKDKKVISCIFDQEN